MEGGGVWRKPCLFVRQPDASRPCLPVRTVSGSLPLEQYLTRTKAVWPAPPPLAPGPLSSSPRVAPQELELQCCHHHSTKSDSEGTPCVWEVRAPSHVASLPTSPFWVHRGPLSSPPPPLLLRNKITYCRQTRGVGLWLWRGVGRDSDSETDMYGQKRAEGQRQRSRDNVEMWTDTARAGDRH